MAGCIRRIITLSVVYAFGCLLYANIDQEQQLIHKAYEGVQQEDYNNVLIMLEDADLKDARVYYLLCTCYEKVNNKTKAIVSAKKGQQVAGPSLFLLFQECIDRLQKNQHIGLMHNVRVYMLFVAKALPPIAWQGVILVLSYIFFFMMLFGATRRMRVYSLIVGVIALCLLAVYIPMHIFTHRKEAIIIQEQDLCSLPKNEWKTQHKIAKGTCVKVVEHRENWYRIESKNHRGWLSAQALELI